MTLYPRRRIQHNAISSDASLNRFTSVGVAISSETASTSWVADSPSTATITDDVFRWGGFFSLRLTNSTGDDIVLSTTEESISGFYASQELIFNCLLLTETNATVSAYLHESTEPYTSVEPNIQETIAGSWSPVFSNTYTFGDELTTIAYPKITIVISSNTTKPCYFTCPTFTLATPEDFNQFVVISKQFFPDVFLDFDGLQTNPTNPMLKLYHSLTADASLMMDEYVRIHQFDNDEMGPREALLIGSPRNTLTRSTLVDPGVMTDEYLAWAGMFIGTRLINDILISGTSIFTDEEFDFLRWQISTAAYGQRAGSRTTMKLAAQTILSDTKSVLVTPLWDGETFHIRVRTLTSETPGVSSEGDESAELLAVLEPTRPAGFILSHSAVDSIPFVLNDADFGIFDQNVLG